MSKDSGARLSTIRFAVSEPFVVGISNFGDALQRPAIAVQYRQNYVCSAICEALLRLIVYCDFASLRVPDPIEVPRLDCSCLSLGMWQRTGTSQDFATLNPRFVAAQ